ncbi:MAG: PKD domain-containing protein [Planctomycetota bacterium]|jgi:hypothetical protein
MKPICCLCCFGLVLAASAAGGEILLDQNFERADLRAGGWQDLKEYTQDKQRLLSVVFDDGVKPASGRGMLRLDYPKGSTGGWMKHPLKRHVDEVYCRYYRCFPPDWEWPKGYGPHDSAMFAGPWGPPTNATFEILVDFNNRFDTFMKISTTRQKWGYQGFGKVLQRYSGSSRHLGWNVSRPEKVRLGRWHCVEYHSKLSDAGKPNGVLRMWVNGKLTSNVPALPLVDESHGGIQFQDWFLGPYFHGGSHKVQHNYLDALVVSTEYIGTLEQMGNQPPRARFTHSRPWGSMTADFGASRSADPEGGDLTYSWDFGDGKEAAGVEVSHTYTNDGEYTVELTVCDPKGEKHSAERRIAVGRTVGSGEGLKAEFYSGTKFEGMASVVAWGNINHQRSGWAGRFLTDWVGNDKGTDYSARWTGYVQPAGSEEYKLTYEVCEGGAVWLNGKLVVEFRDQPPGDDVVSKTVSVGRLEAGRKYPLEVEFFKSPADSNGPHNWRVILSWESPSVKRQPVPTSALYYPGAFEEP